MYIRRFRYSSENVQCKYCTEYRGRKNRCQLTRCPWIAERVEAGAVTYKEAVRSIVPQFCVYRVRAERLIREYEGSLWLSSKHKNCMQWFNHQLGYVPERNTYAYYATMYLLTSNEELHKRTSNCFYSLGIELSYAVLRDISPHNYALFCGASEIYNQERCVTASELADPEIIDDEAFRLLINAKLIAQYGTCAFALPKENNIYGN